VVIVRRVELLVGDVLRFALLVGKDIF